MTGEHLALDPLASADVDDLVVLARALFPHDGLGDVPYREVVAYVVADAERAPALLHLLLDGLATLRSAVGGALGAVPESGLVAAIEGVEGTAFFRAFRDPVRAGLYLRPDVRSYIGYPGPAFELGGYLNRGFDDLRWLPDPRVTESDEEFVEIGAPARATDEAGDR